MLVIPRANRYAIVLERLNLNSSHTSVGPHSHKERQILPEQPESREENSENLKIVKFLHFLFTLHNLRKLNLSSP